MATTDGIEDDDRRTGPHRSGDDRIGRAKRTEGRSIVTPSGSETDNSGRGVSGIGFHHYTPQAGENCVAVVGRHDLRSPDPEVPSHLIEITRVALDSSEERTRNGSDRTGLLADRTGRETQRTIVRQFLAD